MTNPEYTNIPKFPQDKVSRIIGNYRAFFKDLLSRLLQAEINIEGKPISHICYRVNMANYETVRDQLKRLSSAIAEHGVGGRAVAEFLLKEHLDLGNGYSTGMLEFLPHKEGRDYREGLENVGVLIGNQLPEFEKQNRDKFTGYKDRGADLQIPYVTFELGKTVKFYDRSLEQIVIERGSSFNPIT